MKALIVEDDADVVEAISLCLQLRWPDALITSTAEGTEGVGAVESGFFDIVILDLNLPDIDGIEALKQIRSFSNVPIIIVTVRGKEDDQAMGLEMGADDYVVKPFRPRDLVARINSVLRRARVSQVTSEQHTVVRGKVLLNLAVNEVQIGEEIVRLTETERKVLYVLMKNAGRTLGSKEILQEVWGEEYANTDLVRTYVRRLRGKLNDNPAQMILNERGQGYRFVEPA